ncbi:MAG: hypothetical protein SGILL_006145 [Bacillariaceae sp.]
MNKHTYYDVLEISATATPLDVKRAYRRLALQHHPDRNHGSRESEERFKLIGQAYDVLSDPVKKYDYDVSLQRPARSTTTSTTQGQQKQQYEYYDGSRRRAPKKSRVFPMRPPAFSDAESSNTFDAFAQFDRNFGHDPFFQEAFRDMDEEFARRFQSKTKGEEVSQTEGQANSENTNQATSRSKAKSKEGWIPWLLRQCGIEVQITSYTSDMRGGVTATHYSSSAKKSYAQKQNQAYRDRQGRQVRVQSIEKNGNQIEDTFVNNQLVQRKINGAVVEPLQYLGRS